MLSVPHRTTATVSGHTPPFSCFCTSSNLQDGHITEPPVTRKSSLGWVLRQTMLSMDAALGRSFMASWNTVSTVNHADRHNR